MELVFTIALLVLMLIVFLYLSSWFSGLETAITGISPPDMASMRSQGMNTKYVMKLKRDMDRTLIAILIGNNVVNIILSAVTALIANEILHELGVTIMIGVLTFLLIIFGEVTPKSGALDGKKELAMKRARTLYYLSIALAPLITLLIRISKFILKLQGRPAKKGRMLLSDEDIKNLASLGEEEGLIKPMEKEIIHKVFSFGDKKVKDIMIPMSKVFSLPAGLDVQEAKSLTAKQGFTRVPVIHDDNVDGILYAKDLLEVDDGNIGPLLHEPHIAKEQEDISDVLNRMKRMRMHMAVVKDNSGKNTGLVTLEDIIEEIVGDIKDEYFERKVQANG